MTITKTCIVFYSCWYLLFCIISVGEIQTKGKTRKHMVGNGIAFFEYVQENVEILLYSCVF